MVFLATPLPPMVLLNPPLTHTPVWLPRLLSVPFYICADEVALYAVARAHRLTSTCSSPSPREAIDSDPQAT
jgi:hypothetical protein